MTVHLDEINAAPVETIGERLKRLRLERGLSQRELATHGVSYAYISRIEAGTRNPSVKALRRLSERLGVTADYLETGQESVCVAVPRNVADVLFRSGTRVEDGDEFGLDDLGDEERSVFDRELQTTLMRTIRSVGFGLRFLREMEVADDGG